MNREAALKKVLKCLRLSKSANEHEAAAALRQARKLMDEYGITSEDAATSEYAEARSHVCARGTSLPCSLNALIRLVAEGYRCEPVCVVRRTTWGSAASIRVAFVGRGADPTVAAYAFDVLRRQLDRARLKHIGRVRKRANREARGEVFARGWVSAVQDLFPAADQDEQQLVALKQAVSRLHPEVETRASREIKALNAASSSDWVAGRVAGKHARLHAGVAGEGQRRLGHD